MEHQHGNEHKSTDHENSPPSCCARHSHALNAEVLTPRLKDPVCGMMVTAQSKHSHPHENRSYYFCSAGCKTKFSANPSNYLPLADRTTTSHAEESLPIGTLYICPMHPEIRQDHQGSCPKCGMALEPELPSLEEGPNPELTDFQHRFWWTLPLTIAVTVLAMFGHRLQWFDMHVQS